MCRCVVGAVHRHVQIASTDAQIQVGLGGFLPACSCIFNVTIPIVFYLEAFQAGTVALSLPLSLRYNTKSTVVQVVWDRESGQFLMPHSAFTKVFQVRTELQVLDPSTK